MPGFDGTGPLGQGPMTGRGQGFCVFTTSRDNPNQIQGCAGIDGKPIGQMNETLGIAKEVIDMPFGDGTGPAGMGPMTGRAAGFCAGYPTPGYVNPVVGRAGFYSRGVPASAPYSVPYGGWTNPWVRRGSGFAFGRGVGRGWGRGRGRGRFGYSW